MQPFTCCPGNIDRIFLQLYTTKMNPLLNVLGQMNTLPMVGENNPL